MTPESGKRGAARRSTAGERICTRAAERNRPTAPRDQSANLGGVALLGAGQSSRTSRRPRRSPRRVRSRRSPDTCCGCMRRPRRRPTPSGSPRCRRSVRPKRGITDFGEVLEVGRGRGRSRLRRPSGTTPPVSGIALDVGLLGEPQVATVGLAFAGQMPRRGSRGSLVPARSGMVVSFGRD